MSHEFDRGVYVGVPAWHQLGAVLPQGASVEEAIAAGDLARTYTKHDLFAATGQAIPDKVGVFDDLGRYIGTVGSDYSILQPGSVIDFFRPFIDDGRLSWASLVHLDEGRRMVYSMKLNQTIQGAASEAPRELYLFAAQGFDGSLALTLGTYLRRVECANMLRMALGRNHTLNLRHTKNLASFLPSVSSFLDAILGDVGRVEEAFKTLANGSKPRSEKQIREYFATVGGIKLDNEGKPESKQGETKLDALMSITDAQAKVDMPGVRGTWLALLEKYTWFATHAAGQSIGRNVGADNATRMNSLLVGAESDNMAVAMNLALRNAQL